MEEERIARALARIEAAAKRIEAAATTPDAPSPAITPDADLVRRHEALRSEARAALAQIDSLIAKIEA